MDLSDVGFGGMSVFTKTTGAKFRGRISTKTTIGASGSAGLLEQLAQLTVRPKEIVNAGDVFTTDGKTFLVANNGNHFEGGTISKVFTLIPMNILAPWLQYSATTSNVTGIPGGAVYTAHPTYPNIWCMIQPAATMTDGLLVPRDTYQIVTGYAVKEKDKVNGLVLNKVSLQLGVYIAEGK